MIIIIHILLLILLVLVKQYSDITSFFRFVNERESYPFGIISLAYECECDWLFHWQHKLCATFSANVNINYRLPIKVYYRICTLRHIRIEYKSWKPECVLSFSMDWRILVNFIPRFLRIVVYSMLLISLDCLFLIAPSVFSDAYLYMLYIIWHNH